MNNSILNLTDSNNNLNLTNTKLNNKLAKVSNDEVIRNGDTFIPRKYSNSQGHQLYRIAELLPNGDITLQTTRAQGEYDEDD